MALKVPADRAMYGFAKIALTDPGFRSYFSPFAFHGRGGVVIGRRAPPQKNAGTSKIAAKAGGSHYGVAKVRHVKYGEMYIPHHAAKVAEAWGKAEILAVYDSAPPHMY